MTSKLKKNTQNIDALCKSMDKKGWKCFAIKIGIVGIKPCHIVTFGGLTKREIDDISKKIKSVIFDPEIQEDRSLVRRGGELKIECRSTGNTMELLARKTIDLFCGEGWDKTEYKNSKILLFSRIK